MYLGTPSLFISAGYGGESGFMCLDRVLVIYEVPYVIKLILKILLKINWEDCIPVVGNQSWQELNRKDY